MLTLSVLHPELGLTMTFSTWQSWWWPELFSIIMYYNK